MTNIHIFDILVKYKFLTFFIDCIISQMHADVLHVFTSRCNIIFSGKTSQTLFVYEDSQRIHSCQKHIDPQVKF